MFIDLKSETKKVGKTLTTMYTVPSGKKAIVSSIFATNLAGTSNNVYAIKNNGSTDLPVSSRIQVNTSSTLNVIPDNLMLNSGESLKVISDNATGKVYTNQTLPLQASESLNKIKNLNGNVVLMTSAGRIIKKNDSDDNFTVLSTTGLPANTSINDIEYGNGTFVAVVDTSTTQIYTSTNLISWTAQNTGLTAAIFKCVTYANSLWVLGSGTGGSGGIHTSASPSTSFTTRYTGSVAVYAITYCSGLNLWVAGTGSTAGMFVTAPANAITWTERTSTYGGANTGVVYDGTRVWIFSANYAQYSTDGTNLFVVPSGTNGYPYSVAGTYKIGQSAFFNGKVFYFTSTNPRYLVAATSQTLAEYTEMSDVLETGYSNQPVNVDPQKIVFTGLGTKLYFASTFGNDIQLGFVDNYSASTFGSNSVSFTANISEVTL